MTVKCTFCNDTKQEPGIPGPCVWCEQVGSAPVAVGYQLAKGFTDPVGDCEKFEAGITVNAWFQRIVVYGDSPADAEALRDHIMSSAEREAALREELAGASRANHNCKVALKVANTNTKQILDRESETVALKQRDLVEAQTAVTGWSRKYDALQQRLTVAEQRVGDLELSAMWVRSQLTDAVVIHHIDVMLKPAAEGEGS